MTTRGAARALLALLVSIGALGAVVASPVGSASAQTSTVDLTLLSQTPWTGPDDPETRIVESELRVTFVAANRGQARVAGLEVTLSLGPSFLSRSQFDSAIAGGPISRASGTSVAVDGRIEPGTARTFTVALDMATDPAVNGADSRVYPLTVELLSAGDVVGALTSAAIHLVQPPEQPVRMAWWTEMSTPVAFDPAGRLTDPGLEAAVTPDGPLSAQIAALAMLTDNRGPKAAIDLVVEPALLDQLEHMAGGYRRADGTDVAAGEGPSRDAASLLEGLRTVAGTTQVQVSAYPFAGPSIPAMLTPGLFAELVRQDDAGVRTLDRVLGVDPTTSVARPPGGFLDDAALQHLAAEGTVALLADQDEIDRPPVGELQLTPSATATMSTSAGTTTLVLPDPGAQRLFTRADLLADPVRASQIVLAQLAVIWKELPNPAPQDDGSPTVRGVAIAPPADLPTEMWAPLFQRLANAPFLVPTHAQAFVEEVTPATDVPTPELRAPDTLRFTPTYVADMLGARRDTTAYISMLVEDSPVPERLRSDLLYATSRQYLPPNEPGGRPWLDAVTATTEPAFTSVKPIVDQAFTFTSQEGTIPLQMGDPGDTPLRVTVLLQSSQFEFPNGDRQDVVLERPSQIVSFAVIAKAAGRNAIKVLILAPSGDVVDEQTITVASTAVNRIALLVTLVAAVSLMALYGRRQIRRRRAAV